MTMAGFAQLIGSNHKEYNRGYDVQLYVILGANY